MLLSSPFNANEAFEKSKVEATVGEGRGGVAEFVEVVDRQLAELLVVGDRHHLAVRGNTEYNSSRTDGLTVESVFYALGARLPDHFAGVGAKASHDAVVGPQVEPVLG